MEQPVLVTVYITNYNYGKYIRQAVDSVLNQTLTAFEVVIIDDGSTDDSKGIIETYKDDPRVSIIYQQNKGLNRTNNIAMRVANGKYIMRLDADDYLDPNALLVLSTTLENDHDLGLVFPDYYLVDAKGDVLSIERRHSFAEDVTMLDQPAHGACTMIRKSFLERLGGYNELFSCQDGYDLWIKFTNNHKVTNVNTPLFYYRQHGENLTSKEDRILNTRQDIKEVYIRDNEIPVESALAIIPIRASKLDGVNIGLVKVGEQTILDAKIEALKSAKRISSIVITSPDESVKAHYEEHYKTDDQVIFHERSLEQARINKDLVETLEIILDLSAVKAIDPKNIMVLSIEYPFINAKHVDDAVNTLYLFKADTVISVREETGLLFQHDGNGMRAILRQDEFTKLERDSVFKYTGGITLIRTDVFKSNRKFIAGRVSHVVVDQKASQSVKSAFDYKMAQFLAQS